MMKKITVKNEVLKGVRDVVNVGVDVKYVLLEMGKGLNEDGTIKCQLTLDNERQNIQKLFSAKKPTDYTEGEVYMKLILEKDEFVKTISAMLDFNNDIIFIIDKEGNCFISSYRAKVPVQSFKEEVLPAKYQDGYVESEEVLEKEKKDMEPLYQIKVKSAEFQKFGKIAFSSADEGATNPQLRNVNFRISDNMLSALSLDGYIFANGELPLGEGCVKKNENAVKKFNEEMNVSEDGEFCFAVSPSDLKTALSAINTVSTFAVAVTRKYIIFGYKGFSFKTMLQAHMLDRNKQALFVNSYFKRVCGMDLVVDFDGFRNAIKLLTLHDKGNHYDAPVHFASNGDSIILKKEEGIVAVDLIDRAGGIKDLDIYMNAGKFDALFKSLEKGNLVIRVDDEKTPVIFANGNIDSEITSGYGITPTNYAHYLKEKERKEEADAKKASKKAEKSDKE